MSQFDTTGSGHLPVGSARIHLDNDGCNHPEAETAALREYFTLLEAKRDRGNDTPTG